MTGLGTASSNGREGRVEKPAFSSIGIDAGEGHFRANREKIT